MARKLRVLAIDDNLDNLIVLKALLTDVLPETEVLTALTGTDGILLAKQSDPDVILLDVVMPGMDGYQVCRALKQDAYLQIIPVLFVTAMKTCPEVRTRAIEAGAEAFLSKPLDQTELKAQVLAMAKIKAGNVRQIQEQERLETLVAERTRDIKQELASRRQVEQELLLTNRTLQQSQAEKQLIIEFQRQLFAIKDLGEVYRFVGRTLQQLLADGFAVVTRFDAAAEAMKIAYYGFAALASEAAAILGTDPEKVDFQLQDMLEEQETIFMTGQLEPVKELYTLLKKKIPRETCYSLERLLQINYIYVMGFVSDRQQLGAAIVLTRSDILPLRETIEIIVNQAAATISRIKADHASRVSEERYRSIFEQAPFGLALVDSRTRKLKDINPKFAELIGRSIDDCPNIDWVEITHPADIEQNLRYLAQMNDGLIDGYSLDKRFIRPDGSMVWVNLTAAKLTMEEAGPSYVCMIMDITEKKEREQKIEYISYHDVLTGLHNRAFFEEMSDHLDDDRNLPLSLITGDINGLKLINDTLGHHEGDKLLVEIAGVLKACCRPSDVIARIGGDEFSILLPRTSAEETELIVEQIYSACRDYKGRTDIDANFLSISLGCATKTHAEEPFPKISKMAEDHMYRRKLLEHKSFHSSLIASMRMTLFEKSHETEEHAARLVDLSRRLGKQLGLKDEQISELELLSTLHDIGKISVDDRILTKPGKLTEQEWREIKKHPAIGYRIAMTSPELQAVAEYILSHHERWDGKGYPQGLRGEDIPLLSRLLAVIDAYDAMTEDRPYRQALSVEQALLEIELNAGTQLDPEAASMFVRMVRESCCKASDQAM